MDRDGLLTAVEAIVELIDSRDPSARDPFDRIGDEGDVPAAVDEARAARDRKLLEIGSVEVFPAGVVALARHDGEEPILLEVEGSLEPTSFVFGCSTRRGSR